MLTLTVIAVVVITIVVSEVFKSNTPIVKNSVVEAVEKLEKLTSTKTLT